MTPWVPREENQSLAPCTPQTGPAVGAAANLRAELWGIVDSTGVNKVDCQIRFQGQWFDDESRLCYNRFRYYDGEVGQFLCKDPIGLAGGVEWNGIIESKIS
jgi:RHS repeat-associated protein